MKTILLLLLGAVQLVALTILVIAIRRKSKKNAIDRAAVENFLGSLYESFYNAYTKHVNYLGPQRSNEYIASNIANDIANDLLGSKLEALMSNISSFPKKQRKTFGRDVTSNYFIDNMIPNLASLYEQYSNKTRESYFGGKSVLFKMAKIKTLEILNNNE